MLREKEIQIVPRGPRLRLASISQFLAILPIKSKKESITPQPKHLLYFLGVQAGGEGLHVACVDSISARGGGEVSSKDRQKNLNVGLQRRWPSRDTYISNSIGIKYLVRK